MKTEEVEIIKLNKMTSYAIRIISRIALEEDDTVTSKTIEEKEGIPHGVLMKVLRILRQSGLIESHQGRGGMCGGFSLNQTEEGITVYHVIKAMEGGVDLYPLCDEAAYRDENSEIYRTMQKVNKEYIESLSRIRIL